MAKCALLGLLLMQSVMIASGQSGRPTIDSEGTVHISPFAVPLSSHMSDEAKRRFIEQTRTNPSHFNGSSHHPACPGRANLASSLQPLIERAEEKFPVTIEEQVIAGVHVHVVTPRKGLSARNLARVLINLHGGSFDCATAGGSVALVESIPIAGASNFKVIAIDYRTLPDAHFPDATEDVAHVYTELLKIYKPEDIGIYGASTGASLTAGAVAWFQKNGLPRPGAIGLFCEGANKDDEIGGDSSYVAPVLMGQGAPNLTEHLGTSPYLAGTSPQDPLVAPVASLEVLSRFPPTLLVSGTRDLALSEVLYTHTRLVEARVAADLHVWDGMWHGFFYDVALPESEEVFDVIARFFDQHLGSTVSGRH